VSGKADVAHTGATVGGKVDCVQQFLHCSTGSPNIYLMLSGYQAQLYG